MLCFFFCKRFQWIEPVPEFCKAYRHYRYTFQKRQITGQIPDRPFQLFPVIDSFTQHDLPVHLNTAPIELIHFLQGVSGEPVVQHSAPEFGIRCLERDIDRFQTITYDPFNIMIAHISECHIISLQKRQAGIIIFKVKRIPHS